MQWYPRCLLLVGGVAALWLLLFHSEDERLLQIQEQRRTRLEEICATENNKTALEELTNVDLSHFIVDDQHGMIYCYVPKAACTNWKRVLYVLKHNQSAPRTDPLTISRQVTHSFYSLTYLGHLPIPERKARLKHYTKFLFVRDPFVRLVSAYKDKFRGHNEVFYQHYGRNILQRYAHMPYPPSKVDETFEFHPTFKQFVEYLMDPLTEKTEPYDEHWRQMHRIH